MLAYLASTTLCLHLLWSNVNGEDAGSERILNGVVTKSHAYPSLINVKYPANVSREPCVGVLVHPSWVIMTGWCQLPEINTTRIDQSPIEEVVRMSAERQNKAPDPIIYPQTFVAADFDDQVEEEFEQRISPTNESKFHPKFDQSAKWTSANNIILMKMESPFELNDMVQPAALPMVGYVRPKTLEIVGWGAYKLSDPEDSHMPYEAHVPLVDHDTCIRMYNDLHPGNGDVLISETTFCAGSTKQTACYGDWSSPLYATLSPKKHVVLGLETLFGCFQDVTVPSTYVDISKVTDWIASATGLCLQEEGQSKVGYLGDCSGRGAGDVAGDIDFTMAARLSENLCGQYGDYQQSGDMPEPVKETPSSSIQCGLFGRRKCDDNSCFSFDFKMCP